MKMLHIGNPNCLKRYTQPTDFTKSVAVVDMPMGLPVSDYLQNAADADVLVADAIAQVPGELIRAMPRLKLIHSEGVAYNSFDLAAANERGIYVCNSAGMNAQAVAQQTLLLMLGVLHNVVAGDTAVREGRQMQIKSGHIANGDLRDLADCTVGLIGLGNIGQATAKLLAACGAKVLYTQRRRAGEETERECAAEWCQELNELLGKCDIVSLHLPVTSQTERMCGTSFFAAMKPGAYFINTARGELVDDGALIAALESGRLAMAGLDTLDDEPVAKTHVLLNLPPEISQKILFSPHIGGITRSSFCKGYRIIWGNIERIAAGDEPVNIVNTPARA